MNNKAQQDKLEQHLSSLEQDQDNLSLLLQICNLYFERGDLDSAQHHLEKANAIDKQACLGHYGLLYLGQGNIAEAKTYFHKALLAEDNPVNRYNLGFTHFAEGDLDKALTVLSPILEGDHYPLAELLIAKIAHQQEDLDKAISLVENILAQNPNDVEALGFLALLYFDVNDEKTAQEFSTQALVLDPENYDARLVRVMLGLITQETQIDEIEDLLDINSQDARLWFALGSTHMSAGAFEDAEHSFHKAIEIYPGFYDCHIALAWCQLLNNNLDAAQESYQNAIELVDDLADGWGGLALVYALREELPKAEQFIHKSQALSDECFMTEIAEIICQSYNNPNRGQKELVSTLKNEDIPISEKIAYVIEEVHTAQLH